MFCFVLRYPRMEQRLSVGLVITLCDAGWFNPANVFKFIKNTLIRCVVWLFYQTVISSVGRLIIPSRSGTV